MFFGRHCVIIVSAHFRLLSTARTVGESVEDVVQYCSGGITPVPALPPGSTPSLFTKPVAT